MNTSSSPSSNDDPVIITGVRTPFVRSYNAFADLSAYDLGRYALAGLIAKTNIDPNMIQHLVMGTVIHDPSTSNIARECLLGAGLPEKIPANTVTLACISSNVAATQISDMIRLQRIDFGVFSGVDTCSDPPIRVSKKMRKNLVKMSKMKSPLDIFKIFKGLKLKDLGLDIPKVAEFSNGKSMGQGAELLAQQAGVTREQTDAYAEMSHQRAIKAQAAEVFQDHIISVTAAPKFKHIEKDDGPRADTTLENLSKLKPVFDKTFGICTAGNSSFLTDGASAVLMTSRKRAKELGLSPKAVLRDYVYVAGSALYDMLSGPALAIPKLLEKNNLKIEDIAVWEIHEAFAAQMVANINLLKSDEFAKSRLGLKKAVGEIPLEQLNIWGGSLSLGHPFGATGGRLIMTAADRLVRENVRYAVVSGCAAGGHGSAILLENANWN